MIISKRPILVLILMSLISSSLITAYPSISNAFGIPDYVTETSSDTIDSSNNSNGSSTQTTKTETVKYRRNGTIKKQRQTSLLQGIKTD